MDQWWEYVAAGEMSEMLKASAKEMLN